MGADIPEPRPSIMRRLSHRLPTVGGGAALGAIVSGVAVVLGFWAGGRLDMVWILPLHHVFSTMFIVSVPNLGLCLAAMIWAANGTAGRQRGWGWMCLGVAISALMMSGVFSIYTMGFGLTFAGVPVVETVALLAWFSFGCFSGVPAMVLALVGTMLAKQVEAKRWSYIKGVPPREPVG